MGSARRLIKERQNNEKVFTALSLSRGDTVAADTSEI